MGKEFFDHPENIFPSNSSDISRVCRSVFQTRISLFIILVYLDDETPVMIMRQMCNVCRRWKSTRFRMQNNLWFAAMFFLKCGQILSDVPNPSRLVASPPLSCLSSTVQLAIRSIPCTRCAPTRTIKKVDITSSAWNKVLKKLILDYLKSAICIKSAAIEETGCKTFYDELLQEINSPSESETLCW